MGGDIYVTRTGPRGDWVSFKGTFTAATGGSHVQGIPWKWYADIPGGSIWRYTNKSKRLYVCPSDRHSVDSRWTVKGGFGLSYTLNFNLVYPQYGGNPNKENPGAIPAFESEVVRSSKTVLLADHGDGSINKDPQFATAFAAHPELNNRTAAFDGLYRWWQEAPTPVHNGGQNWVFCDGHAKWFNLKQWKTLVFYRSGNPPNYWTNPAAEGY
jgi:prepilin-type processing-associated H-X9-DG protein